MSRHRTSFAGSSLVELLRVRAADQPGGRAYTFLRDGESESATLTWAGIEQRSRAIAAELQSRLSPGDRALLLYPPGLEFIAAFFGCLFAGVVAVPALPPRAGRSNRGHDRLAAIVADAGPEAALTSGDSLDRWPRDEALHHEPGQPSSRLRPSGGASATPEESGLPCVLIATDRIADDAAGAWRDPGATAGSRAFIQYTSGSTADPKGVMVSHGNLLHNLTYACRLAENDDASVSVSWLPVTHDMGLIEGVLQPAFCGCPAYLMSPAAFLQRPVRWLRALSRYRATRSGGPNFAYDLAVRRVGLDQSEGLDLGAWCNAYNGAEPIRPETMAAFSAAFAHCGFRATAFRPCYGLAEHTLLVSSGRWNGDGAMASVGCGTPALGTRVLIVDPGTFQASHPGDVGEIWVAGPSVALGYRRRPDESERTFMARTADGDGPFLRTGDLGCVVAGELIVTGRLKDLLIVRGFKHFPQDLEHTAGRQHPGIQPGSAVAVALDTDVAGDRIVIVVEAQTRKVGGTDETALIIAAIRTAIAEDHGVQVHGVVLVAAGAVPRTSSGKLQRFACRQALQARTMPILASWGDTVPADSALTWPAVLTR